MPGSEGMSITIDVREVDLAVAELALGAEKVAQVLRTEIMAQSMRTITRVKTDMPKLTGRAAASWGTPGEEHEAGDAVARPGPLSLAPEARVVDIDDRDGRSAWRGTPG